MSDSIGHAIKLVEGAENMFDTCDLTNVDSVGMLDISAHDTELALTLGSQRVNNPIDSEYYNGLISRMKILRAKIEAVKSKL